MAITASTVEAFLNSLTALIESIRSKDLSKQMQQAETARHRGQLVAINPDFIRHLKTRCHGVSPGVAVDIAVEVLLTIATAQSEPELKIS